MCVFSWLETYFVMESNNWVMQFFSFKAIFRGKKRVIQLIRLSRVWDIWLERNNVVFGI